MNHKSSTANILLAIAAAMSLSSCSMISQFLPGKSPGGQSSTTGGQQSSTNSLAGDWQLAFAVNGQTVKVSMHLDQNGNQFSGTATEQASGQQFMVAGGQVSSGKVAFSLTNGGSDSQPLQYSGTVEAVNDKDYQGPWMHGTFVAQAQGVQGDWEAQMTNPPRQAQAPIGAGLLGGGGSQTQPGDAFGGGSSGTMGSAPSGGGTATSPNGAPQLSGKWNCAYEYNFKTVKSIMYLEQDNGKLSGHGIDLNTKEKFVIAKGWYAYPKVTIIRKYEKGKGAAANRTLTFKAEVKVVNESDYQGPYMNGKTQGGGGWEAQLIR